MTGFYADKSPDVQRPTFFFDVVKNCDMVEIRSITDTKSTVIKKVTPDVVEQFQREWDAYKAGRPADDVGGTPLTEVPGLERNAIVLLSLKGIRNAEELASLSDSMAQQLGMGVLSWCRTARLLVKSKQFDALEEATAPKRGPGRPRKDEMSDEQQRA